jgi:hypothetical protein
MKSIHINVLCAMTTVALACSSSGGGSSPQWSDGGGSRADGVTGATSGDDSGATSGSDSGATSDDDSGTSTSGSDASAVDAGDNTMLFLGTWPGEFSTSENCPTSIPTMSTRADMLVITSGPAEAGAGVISVLTENGCVFDYAVDGYGATTLQNQLCRETKDGSVTEYLAVVSRTLTLGGGKLNEIGSVVITKNGVPCSDTEQGTYAQ